MKIINVPQDKDPILLIVEMGESAINSWIFLDEKVFETMKSTADIFGDLDGEKCLTWNRNGFRFLLCEQDSIWFKIISISDNRTSNSKFPSVWRSPEIPEEVILLQMAE